MADFQLTGNSDTVDGTEDADTISGVGGGNDIINGNGGDDVIRVRRGAHTIDGGAGTDRLFITSDVVSQFNSSTVTGIGSGTWTLDGATLTYRNIEGITYRGSAFADTVNFGVGNHVVDLDSDNDTVFIADGSATINGSNGADTVNFAAVSAAVSLSGSGAITGTTFNGSLTSVESVAGTLFGDTLIAATNTTQMSGEGGNDILDSGANVAALALRGGDGNDIYVVRGGSSVAAIETADGGIDRVETDIASYTLADGIEDLEYFGAVAFTGTGNSAANVIVGGGMGDTITGLGGDDTLGGEAGNDSLDGGDGNDRLIGGTGIDTMSGGAGNDIMVVDVTGDIARGGDGIDTVQFVTSIFAAYTAQADVENFTNANNVFINATLNSLDNVYGGGADQDLVSGGDGNDILYGRGNADPLSGNNGDDRLYGEAGNDQLSGGAGNDKIYGGADNDDINAGSGDDVIYGEAGNDRIIGGQGADLMSGGAGADRFDINGNLDTGSTLATADRITDFNGAQGDRLVLQGIDANTNVASDQAFSFIGTAAFSNTAGELRYYALGSQTVLAGDTNGDGVADVLIRFDGSIAFTATDFLAL